MECATNALLSIPVIPRDTYAARLALAGCKTGSGLTEQDLWKSAQCDRELLHRVTAIHHFLCGTLKLGALTEVVEQWLKAQENGARHVA